MVKAKRMTLIEAVSLARLAKASSKPELGEQDAGAVPGSVRRWTIDGEDDLM
jgi:hypothetical protein